MCSSFKEACRICLRQNSIVSISTKVKNSDFSYFDLLKLYVYSEIAVNDRYPSRICLECLQHLECIQNFHSTLLRTEEKLKSNVRNDAFQNKPDIANQTEYIDYRDIQCTKESTNLLEVGVKQIEKQNNELKHTSDIRLYSCNKCKKSFRRFQYLKVHKRIHGGERPYSCTECKKDFIYLTTLKQHLKTHSGEKPFMCSICGKSFSQSISLTYHTRIHTQERPFKCNLCGKGFIQKNNLNIHMRFHQNERPYKCQMCERKFFTSSHLKVHIEQHLGEKKHICTLCDKKFLRSGHLKQHLIAHKGEKSHECIVCLRAFTQKGHLNRHMKIHSKK